MHRENATRAVKIGRGEECSTQNGKRKVRGIVPTVSSDRPASHSVDASERCAPARSGRRLSSSTITPI
ncbi:hypothetical protein DPMN_087961 [Dreissena polymorpha]|uniref:Uncharacterized protein n=1 Tax=Dreissena polymorpha TaxID=45954 RepID=A0A9D4KTQ8_DREPO|nr:hypothetical protein DPMN_087961 [Dreissena polymorpha]